MFQKVNEYMSRLLQPKKSMQEELNIICMLLPVPINNSINRENAWSSEFFFTAV